MGPRMHPGLKVHAGPQPDPHAHELHGIFSILGGACVKANVHDGLAVAVPAYSKADNINQKCH